MFMWEQTSGTKILSADDNRLIGGVAEVYGKQWEMRLTL